MIAANRTLVSRSAETAAIGARASDHTTSPYAVS